MNVYGFMITHCVYVDAKLFELRSFTTCRAMDLKTVTSPEIKKWIKDHDIELISYKDLPREWIL